jgi:tetratricopeptide (TPR) repeat protein
MLACFRADLLQDLGLSPEAQAAYQSALSAALTDEQRARAWLGLAGVMRVRDDYDGAFAALANAERFAAEKGLDELSSRAHLLRGNLLFPRGDLDGCHREHERALVLARASGAIELEVAALGGLGDAEFMRGHMLIAWRRCTDCVELARRHGLHRVEAAYRPMAAIARWLSGEAEAALEEALAAIELARKIGHRRAETVAHHGGYQVCHALERFDAARGHADRALELARLLNAPRFEAEALAFRGELLRTMGERARAREELKEALAIARATGMAYMGPVYLGMLANAEDDAASRRAALEEGEALLAGNGLAHNHLLYRRDAIDACLRAGDWPGMRHHADRLQAHTRAQPLPWSDFFIARARALADAAGRAPAGALRVELERLAAEGRKVGQRVAVRDIEEVLQRT